jgi:cytochrome c oxidase assembly factor CtaG
VKLVLVALVASGALFAHTGEPLEPHDLWTAWEFDPGVVIPLILSAILYWRGATDKHGIRCWERVCFWAGWAVLVIALVSPVHPLGEALFSAHMVQHELLMVVAAPLLVLGRPLVPFLWSVPAGIGRVSIVKIGPAAAWLIHAVVLWAWHAPALFQATLTSDLVHSLQHISFLGSALIFWWALLRRKLAYGPAILYVFTTAVHTTILGVLLTFSPTLWYPAYRNTTAAWGMTPLEDQQIGGLVMWVPAGLTFIVAGVYLTALWLRDSEARVLARESGV